MVSVLPDINPDGVYKSGQVCAMLQIGATTLWRYVQKGIIRPGHRAGSKENLYTGREIIKLHRIVY